MCNKQAGAPSYPVFLGRRDGLESNAAWVDYPSSSSSWDEVETYFIAKGLDQQDLVTLLGIAPFISLIIVQFVQADTILRLNLP